MVRAHSGSRGRTSPPPTMSGIRLAPIVDHSCPLGVAGSDAQHWFIFCLSRYLSASR